MLYANRQYIFMNTNIHITQNTHMTITIGMTTAELSKMGQIEGETN